MFLKRLLVTPIIISLVVGNFLPTLAQAVGVKNTKGVLSVSSTASNLPETDWSAIDWEQEVVLPQDFSVYQQKAAEFSSRRDSESLKNLTIPKHKMGDADAMDQYHVPKDIQEMVGQYREIATDKNSDQNRIKIERDFLTSRIKEAHPYVAQNKTVDPNLNSVVDWRKDLKANPKRNILHDLNESAIKADIKNRFIEKQSDLDLYSVSGAGIREQANSIEENLKKRNGRQATIGEYLRAWLGVESVSAGTPIIASYDGIEKYPSDNALYYISTQQNPDGSFGRYNQYETTAEVVFALSDFKLTNNDQYTAAVNFLKNTAPVNLREKAIKARILVGLGQPYQALLDEIIAQKNKDGGYGLQPRYASDVETSAQVAWALWAGSYSISDALPKVLLFITNSIPSDGAMRYTENSNPSYYLINFTAQYLYPFKTLTLAADGGFQISIQSKINSLLNYLNSQYDTTNERLLGVENVIDESATVSTWKIYQVNLDKVAVLNKNILLSQAADGSFDQEIKSTLSVVRALAQGDLIFVDLVNAGNLVNRSQANFTVTIKNRGYDYVATTTFYIFADNYNTGLTFNLPAGTVIKPNETVVVNFNIPDTIGYIGNVDFRLYAEGDRDANYDDNWIAKNFNFASAANSYAALPLYFSVFKYSLNGNPAVIATIPQSKPDPNRAGYILMFKKKTDTNWNYTGYDPSKYIIGYFEENVIYDFSMGVLDTNNNLHYYSNPVSVQMSATDSKYVGGISGFVTLDKEKFPNVGGFTQGTGSVSTDNDGNFSKGGYNNGRLFGYIEKTQYDGFRQSFDVSPNATTTNIRFFSHLKSDTVAPVNSATELRWATTYKVKNQQEYSLLTFGSDNVGIKEGDFYLWNPTNQIWQFLGTAVNQAVNNYAEMKWYVPTDLPLGTGYKIKGNLRDFRGNESVSKEWGPFEIIDGTAPTFTVTSPNGGEIFTLGATNTINWTSSSTGGVSKVSLYLEYPNSFTSLVNNIPNTGSYNWAIPLSSSYTGDKFKIRVRGADAKNFLEGIDNSDNYFTIKDPSAKPADPWAMPQYVVESSTSTASISRDQYMLEYDSSGVAHVVYRYLEDNLSQSPRIIKERLMYLKYQNSTWTEPIVVYEKVWQTDGNLTGYRPVSSLKLKMVGSNPHLMWQSSGGSGGCVSFNDQEIYHYYFDGSKWVGPANLSNNSTESRDPNFTVDSVGNTSVAWVDGATWNDSCQTSGNRTINFISKPLSGSWSAINNLNFDQYPSYPLLAVTADNKLHLVYKAGSENKIKHTIKSGSSWSSSVIVSTSSVDMPVLKSENNNLHYAFREYYQDPVSGQSRSRVMYTWFNGVVWKSNEEVSPIISGMSAEYPKLALAGQGKVQIVYQNYNNNSGQTNLAWTTKLANGSWLSPQNINLASQNYFNSDAVSLAGNGNNLMAVWSSGYLYGAQMVFNTADLTKDFNIPQSVNNITATSTKDGVVLKWDKYLDPVGNFDHFNIYRSQLMVSSTAGLMPLANIANVSSTEYTDNNFPSNGSYYYSVVAVNKSGYESLTGNFVGPISSVYVMPLSVQLVADTTIGVPPVTVKFSAETIGGSASKVPAKLDFSKLNLRNIIPSYASGSAEVQDNGDALYLNKMMWKAVNSPYTITPNTMVELDFKSNGKGWSHGFGFDNGYPDWNVKNYISLSSVYGLSASTDNSFNDYKEFGQWKHYKIPVGKLLANKAYSEMYFNSYCGNSSCPAVFDSYFKNVHVYESDKSYYSYSWDFGDGTPVQSSVVFAATTHQYLQDGDFSAKVIVSDGKNTDTKSVIISPGYLPLKAAIVASSTSGVPPLAVDFSANATDGAGKQVLALDFSKLNLRNIIPSYASGSAEVQDNGHTLYLNKMMWKAVNYSHTITPNTVVELDFKSNGKGWSHGFGFDNGYPDWNVKHFIALSAVYGESPTTDNSFNDYKEFGQWKHYKIPVGKLLANKAYSEMYFNSYCGNSSCPAVFDSYFKNINVYESDKSNYSYSWDFGDGVVTESSPAMNTINHIYNSVGTFNAKVIVSDGKNIDTKSVNINSGYLPLTASVFSAPIIGTSSLALSFTAEPAGGAASKVLAKLDFSKLNLRNIIPSFASGSGEAQDNGDTLYLNKMMWKAVNHPYTITSSTIVELDFKSNGLGWSHGFGFDNGYPDWNVKNYIALNAVYGESANTDNSFKDYTTYGQWKHYKIPVGKLLANKAYSEMYFTSYCGNAWCPAVFDSYFKNVYLYESDKPYYSYTWDFGDGVITPASVINSSLSHTYSAPGVFKPKVIISDGISAFIKDLLVSVPIN